MTNHQPKLSIGLPVYNGEKFLEQALDSILAQTFTDFELIISDNASTDKTEDICRKYAAKDSRIRYYRNQNNIGCARNFNRVFELSTAEYFKWIAYDDLHAPDFVEKCIAILEKDPNLVLCYSEVHFIDQQGKFVQNYNVKLDVNSPYLYKRFYSLLTKHLCYPCYGVIRSRMLKAVPPMGGYGNADGILLLRLGVLGQFYEIPECLFSARIHPEQSMSMFFPNYLAFTSNDPDYSLNMLPDFYSYAVWFDTDKKGKLLLPHWRLLKEYIFSILMFKMSVRDRILCFISLNQQLKGTEWLLIKDLWVAGKTLWRSLFNFSHLQTRFFS
ncbi:glycosyltransferase family 2 protein [Nostoc parmelioides]|uniref:Glycosyltransferase n=1 Tax=Nostoc parmelioides FACHB-3921 TaxID=2692909 RepID=A0ABR8BEB5_9NOSO|nr:glycosyltransferase [Nostoc parmelioides]MBD2251006.1 glycosyltransferase [Nostoc parmelioides FACHB-3921]